MVKLFIVPQDNKNTTNKKCKFFHTLPDNL